MNNSWLNLLSRTLADLTAVANTTTETELARFPLDAGQLLVNVRFAFDAFFKYSTTGTPTLVLGVRIVSRGGAATGGSLLGKSLALQTESGVTNACGRIKGGFTIRTEGASGSARLGAEAKLYSSVAAIVASATGNAAEGCLTPSGGVTPADVTVDTTVDSDLLITAKWSAASSSNTAAIYDYELIRQN